MTTASTENRLFRLVRIFYSATVGFFWYYSPLNKFRKMIFLNNHQLVDAFLDGKSVARFGDGELRIMERVKSDFFQKDDANLATALANVAKSDNDKIIICFPKSLKSLKGLTLKAKIFWISNIYWNRKSWNRYINLDRIYGDALITRPYIDYVDKTSARKRYDNLKRIWHNKKVCIIEGEGTHLGEGNDLLNGAKNIKRLIGPSKNAFDKIDRLFEQALNIDKNYIFIIALGPTATVLTKRLSAAGRVAFDIGHIDIEYEWMLAGAKKKMMIAGKSVNEKRA